MWSLLLRQRLEVVAQIYQTGEARLRSVVNDSHVTADRVFEIETPQRGDRDAEIPRQAAHH